MFKWYGFLGIILVLIVELSFLFNVRYISLYYFPLAWFGFIFIIDALVYKLKKRSLISNNFIMFIGMLLLSSVLWSLFELINHSLNNWLYVGGEFWNSIVSEKIFMLISFSTVVPAIFETFELLRTIHLFNRFNIRRYNISRSTLFIMVYSGVLMLLLSIIFPVFAYPLIWLAFFFMLDPINYIHKQPSIIKHFKEGRLSVPLCLLLAGIICGFFWEFWNYWAPYKWVYNVPFLGLYKIFEMPILGYLGYLPFAFEIYAMYWFVRSLFVHKEHLLE